MELRQLTAEHERQIFAKCLATARSTHGTGFRETPRSALGKAHLAFGGLYALFDHEGEPPERMVGGFIVHDLATLPQSYPKPDLSHLSSEEVLEFGDLWSISPGIGRVAAVAAALVAAVLRAKAMLVYPIVRPIDRTRPYLQYNFVKACEPVSFPYGETLEGGKVWVQPMVLEGEPLDAYVHSGFDLLFRTDAHRRCFRFDRPFPTPPMGAEVSPAAEEREPNRSLISSTEQRDDRNGAATL